MKYKIGDRVINSLNDEGTVIATDNRTDEFTKVKVKFDGFFGQTEWWFESMLDKIITDK